MFRRAPRRWSPGLTAAAALMVAVGSVGCEPTGTMDRKPMDEPLGASDAMRADEAMRRRADGLVDEAGRRPMPASPMSPADDDE